MAELVGWLNPVVATLSELSWPPTMVPKGALLMEFPEPPLIIA